MNLLGMIDMCTTFLPLIKLTIGRIVTTTSSTGRLSCPLGVPNPVSNFGAEAFIDGLRYEYYSSHYL